MACLVGFGYLYYEMQRPQAGPSGTGQTSQDYREVSAEIAAAGVMTPIIEEETDEDLEACFRMARQGREVA